MKGRFTIVILNLFQDLNRYRNIERQGRMAFYGMTILFLMLLLSPCSHAESEQVDLILPPALASKDAPFYEGAQVKIGEALMPVRTGKLPSDQLAAFNPDAQELIISDSQAATETDKGKALFEVLDALQAGAIAPAAGTEAK